jgi:hypothetical protein
LVAHAEAGATGKAAFQGELTQPIGSRPRERGSGRQARDKGFQMTQYRLADFSHNRKVPYRLGKNPVIWTDSEGRKLEILIPFLP